MTAKDTDNVGGLLSRIREALVSCTEYRVGIPAYEQIVAAIDRAELCRAAPAGCGNCDGRGEVQTGECVSEDDYGKRTCPECNGSGLDSAPAGSGEVDGWLLDGCLIYRLSDGRNQTNTHEINVTMWDRSRELSVRDKAAAALLRKLQQGAE